MADSTYGRLTNPLAWAEVLPDHLFSALSEWIKGQPFDLTLHRWFTDGRSGSYVASVRLRPHRGPQRGAILKLVPPHLAAAESRAVGLVEQHTPPDFYERHLVPTEWVGPLPGSAWWLHLQAVAQTDVSTMLPLDNLVDHAELAGYCADIVTALVEGWQGGPDPASKAVPPAEFLRADLAGKLAGLHAFARAVGLDVQGAPDLVVIPGRPDPLPNPFALLERGGGADEIEVFRGNGHGDLHPGNILIPVGRKVRAADFRLIDLGRFSPATPVSRDPVKLILAIADRWLPGLAPYSSLRSSLAELIVAPDLYPRTPPIAGYLEVAEAVYRAAAGWANRRGLVEEWARQYLLVLAASALRTVSRDDVALPDRWWYFELAALALRALDSGDRGIPIDLTTPPSAPRAAPADPPTPRGPDPEPLRPNGAATPPVTPDTAPGLRAPAGRPGSDPTPPGARHTGTGRASYSGLTRVQFGRRLGDSWSELVDLLGMRADEVGRLPQGREAGHIWRWLEVRGRVPELRDALLALDRPDLVQLLDDDEDG
ncbi:hypothetical protein [Plantactinospora endophytica]|uniref:Bacterial Death-like domain-containing protein n=1 Tax=Plantactinospora endophytica TaxID=673535 RepID=A0ABQ4E6B1_9ACTN|nr:hypothetical protein [Plantactinospora endophytica]GIG90268.1 hypothetical protein Pen02_52040 [Plantactinospora endophytica]